MKAKGLMKSTSLGMNFFKNKKGELAIIQFPNPLLLSWLILIVLSYFVIGSDAKTSVQHFSSAVLFAWAYLEVIQGDSGFRRLFGIVILVGVIYNFFV